MRGLDCVSSGSGKITGTESTEVFTISTSNTTLNVPRRDVESQLSNPDSSKPHSIWWTLGVDIPLFIIIFALIGLFELGVLPSYKAGFYCNDPALSFPFTGDTMSMVLLVILLIILPIIIIGMTEYLFGESSYSVTVRAIKASKRTAWLYRSYMYGLLLNLSIVEVMKAITGSPRPTFFDLCEPDTAKTCNGSEFVSTFECTSTKYSSWFLSDSYHSFPSGHTSLSVYCGFFIAWYLQVRAFDWKHRTVFVVPTLQLLCLVFAAVSSLTRITDHRHHWWDVLVGSVVGFISLLYAVYALCDNFSRGSSRQSKEEEANLSTRTLLYNPPVQNVS